MKFNKTTRLPIGERLKIIRRISSEAIKEMKNANSFSELMNKHTSKGVCKICGKETTIITSVGVCINCSVNPSKFKHLSRKMIKGTCSCGFNGLIDKEYNECPSCYAKNCRGVK